jgi:phosphomevalonate kinase
MDASVVVLISGKRGSGKDYFASMVQRTAVPGARPVHLMPTAYFSKREYADKFECSLERLLHDRAFKEKHRDGLIMLAEYQKTAVRPTYWIEQAAGEYRRAAAAKPCVIVVSDFRFECEYQYVTQKLPATIRVVAVRIDASDEMRAARGLPPNADADAHVSECGLDSFAHFDARLRNDGTPTSNAALRACAESLYFRLCVP